MSLFGEEKNIEENNEPCIPLSGITLSEVLYRDVLSALASFQKYEPHVIYLKEKLRSLKNNDKILYPKENVKLTGNTNELKIKEDKKVIDHPARYNGDSVYECIKVMRAWSTPEEYRGFLKNTIIKYLCRLGKKDNNVQELKKARWYLDKLIEEESKIEVAFEEKK